MNEELLSFIWKYKLYENYTYFNIEGEAPLILSQGTQNSDAGPDFIEGKIKAGTTTWVGNVEIHMKSSDWELHKHHLDKAFNNVILQVVNKHDKDVYTEDGRLLPVLEIVVDESLRKKYKEFKESKTWIPCENDFNLVDNFKHKMWIGNIMIERLNKKAEKVEELLTLNNNSWEETFYQLIARSFGFSKNADPFEWLAKSVPLKTIAKHQNNLTQLEAILYGQAGFLGEDIINNAYFLQLKNEYRFLCSKFKLEPIQKHLWKFLRLRPSNFPYIRISQFANLIHNSSSFFSKVLSAKTTTEIKELFRVKASEYWNTHYTFEKKSEKKIKTLGEISVDTIIINTVTPVLFVYGIHTGNEKMKERAIGFLEELKPEKNSVTKGWIKLGVKVESGLESQALLHQKQSYCELLLCLKCGIGLEILKKQISKVGIIG